MTEWSDICSPWLERLPVPQEVAGSSPVAQNECAVHLIAKEVLRLSLE